MTAHLKSHRWREQRVIYKVIIKEDYLLLGTKSTNPEIPRGSVAKSRFHRKKSCTGMDHSLLRTRETRNHESNKSPRAGMYCWWRDNRWELSSPPQSWKSEDKEISLSEFWKIKKYQLKFYVQWILYISKWKEIKGILIFKKIYCR